MPYTGESEKEEIKREFEEGKSVEEIAEDHDLSYNFTRNVLAKPTPALKLQYGGGASEESEEEDSTPVVDQPIHVDAAPRFYLGRLLDRIEFIVAIFAGTMTLLGYLSVSPLSYQVSISLTVTAIGDFGLRHILDRINGDSPSSGDPDDPQDNPP